MALCLIGLGSNVGDRSLALRRALELLRSHAHVTVVNVSSPHETQPIGGPAGQNTFLNAAATLTTDLSPLELFHVLQETEQQLGRVRHQRWGARIVDLDLLLYESHVISTPSLVVPHPRMTFRRFVLVPAVEIAADMKHPSIGWSLNRLLEHLDSAKNYLAITVSAGAAASRLANALRGRCRVHVITTPEASERKRSSSVDSAGPTLKTEIEFLNQCVEKLDQAAIRRPEWMVSDFWLGELLVGARYRLMRADLRPYEEAWRIARQEAISPKLTVLVDAPADDKKQSTGVVVRGAAPRIDRMQADLRQQVMLPGQGPFLDLQGADFDWAVTEVQAAIEAMGD